MSKLGRYSADRKKIDTIGAATTLTVADCGTIFMVSSFTGAIILPSVNPVKRQISLPLNISPFPLLQLNMFQLSSTAVTTPIY